MDLRPEQIYRRNEVEKKRQYNERVINIKQETFTPLVYSTTGGMAKECERYTKTPADKLAAKRGEFYAKNYKFYQVQNKFCPVAICPVMPQRY